MKKDSISGKGIGGVEIELRWETGELIGTYTTDSTGRIYAPLEAEKTVVAREVKTLPEYRLDPTERSVTLESGKANELIFENDPYPYLIIQKIDRSTKEPLSGVQFKISDDLGHEVGTYTTSATGRIVLTGINDCLLYTSSYLGRTEDNRITLITCVVGQDDKRLVVQAVEFQAPGNQ